MIKDEWDKLLDMKLKIQDAQSEISKLQEEYRKKSKAWREWSWNTTDRINSLDKQQKDDTSKLLHAIKPRKK